jgi:hypothetical protein
MASDWDAPGDKTTKLPASKCTEQPIKDEVWAQVKAHHAQAKDPAARRRPPSGIGPWLAQPPAIALVLSNLVFAAIAAYLAMH